MVHRQGYLRVALYLVPLFHSRFSFFSLTLFIVLLPYFCLYRPTTSLTSIPSPTSQVPDTLLTSLPAVSTKSFRLLPLPGITADRQIYQPSSQFSIPWLRVPVPSSSNRYAALRFLHNIVKLSFVSTYLLINTRRASWVTTLLASLHQR